MDQSFSNWPRTKCKGRNGIFILEKNEWWSAPGNQTRSYSFCHPCQPALKDWQGRLQFVDDTTLLEIVPRCSPSLMCTVVDEISQFASSRGMELINPKKCKEIIILSFLKYSLASDNTIYVSGLPVERVSSFKLLGFFISDDLSWNCHVDYVIQKAISRLYALRLLKKAGLGHSDLVNIYCSFIRSRVEHASPALSSLTNYLSDLIESIQKRGLRIIYPDVLSYEDVLICARLKTLAARRHISCINFINRLKSEKEEYNPLACILRKEHPPIDNNYYLRTQSINK